MIKNIRQQHVAIVPHWLADAVMASSEDVTPEVFADYEKLSTIVSESDVSSYHLLQSLRSNYVKGFADMESISMKPNNLKWLEEHASAVAKCQDRFNVVVKTDKENELLSCSNFKPVSGGSDTLILLSSRGDDTSLTFEKDCVGVLSTNMTFDEYKLYDIYREYMVKQVLIVQLCEE